MYGKFFASTFSGSMFGAGPDVFAVWGYVIANAWDAAVELNPALLAATLGTTPERVEAAIGYLTSPDPHSRNPAEQGRRLVHEGAFSYRVVSHEIYRTIRSEDDRRAYNREAQQKSRANKKRRAAAGSNGSSLTETESNGSSLTVNDLSALSAQTEAEAEAEADPDPPLIPPSGGNGTTEPPKASKPSKRAKVELPTGWKPSEAHRAYANQHGVVDLDLEADAFAAHHEAKGSLFADWDAAFRTWLSNRVRWNRERGTGHGGPVNTRPMQPSHGRTGFENARIAR